MSAQRYVTQQEYDSMTTAFPQHVALGPAADPIPIGTRPLRFPVGQLQSALVNTENCDPENGNIRGVVIHFGLDTEDILDVALQFVCLDLVAGTVDTYTFEQPEGYYLITNDQLQYIAGPVNDWKEDDGTRYKNKVVIRTSTTTPWRAFIEGRDVIWVAFPYEDEIDLLIEQNGLGEEDLLELVPIARTEADGDKYQIDVCLAGVDVELDNEIYEQLFKHKAADNASRCPPNCLHVILPK